jgi:two-component system chemotaxis sensor kinase CheA
MAIDLGRFHAAFFEESFEGVDLMEQALLRLDVSADNAETINTIFRAAHSIKGGAATFGFAPVSAFAHHLETLLDRVRSGKRSIDQPLVDLLLRANDIVRELLTAARGGTTVDPASVQQVQNELQAAMDGGAGAAPVAAPQASAAAAAPAVQKLAGYRIRFAPNRDLFLSGNDPLRILREVAALGPAEMTMDFEAAPPFAELDPEACYTVWNIKLDADCPRAAVTELFAWVEDECKLDITPVYAKVQAPPPAAAAPAAAPANPVAAAAAAGAASAPANPVAAAARSAQNPDPQTQARPAAAAASNVVTHPAAKKPAAEPAAQAKRPAATGDGASIRVSTEKIDNLINLVGELVITHAMLAQQAQKLDPVANERLLLGLQTLDQNARRLQDSVMSTRMLPIEAVFSRFPRMVRDLAARLGKQVRLETIGESTELDKSVIEKITDPLTHLVRNAIDHGIEMPDQREAAGKDQSGTITLRAAHQGSQIVIEVIDDGKGLHRSRIIEKARSQGMNVSDAAPDADIWQLIFAPGFSTAEQVTDVSGRGVGMDVVKRNIQVLGGQVELASEAGRGTRVTIRMPLTLAIVDGMSVAVGDEVFIVPLSSVIESLQPQTSQIRTVTGKGRVLQLREEYLPLLALYDFFNIATEIRSPEQGIIVVLEAEGRKVALQVDGLVSQQQVVIKNLESNYRRVAGVSGATILGDGRVALILDAAEMVRGTYRSAAA